MNDDIHPLKIIFFLICIAICIFEIGTCAKYANKPVSEVPAWVFIVLN